MITPLEWTLDPAVDFLNHGSFGSCPTVVQEAQSRLRARLERQPIRFFLRDCEPLLDEARVRLGGFVGADPDDLVFMRNASSAVSTVLRSLPLAAGDEVLTTNHAYNACKNALDEAATRAGARMVVARIPFPVADASAVVEAVAAAITPRTRLALLDHVTSPTGVVMPIAALVHLLAERGIDSIVDGAHAPGMLPLDVRAIGAAYYAGNCHKWLCAPKGVAFLYVRRDLQPRIRPLVISHGATLHGPRGRFRLEFDWTGTDDPTPALCVPVALDALAGAVDGGWPALMARNHALALAARRTLMAALGVKDAPCPDEMIGALAAVPLPRAPILDEPPQNKWTSVLQDRLLERYSIEVPIVPWPTGALVRVSAQLYNRPEQYQRLADALVELLQPEHG